MLHSTAHWQKTIHGYSGYRPALHSEAFEELFTFPDEASLVKLARMQVTYVVLHGSLYKPYERSAVDSRIARYPHWLTLLHTDGVDRVYRLTPPSDIVWLADTQLAYMEAIRERDLAALAGYYTDDALVVRPGGIAAQGQEQIEAWAANALSDESGRILFDIRQQTFNGAEARLRGTYVQHPGPGASRRGEFVQVWRRVEGRWRIAYDIFTDGQQVVSDVHLATRNGPDPATESSARPELPARRRPDRSRRSPSGH